MEHVGSNGTQILLYDLSRANLFADLSRQPWEPVQGLLEFPAMEIHDEIGTFETANPAILLVNFTRYPSVGERIPKELGRNVTFADFTREFFEPYILREVGKRFREVEAQLGYFVIFSKQIFQK